MKLDAGQVHFLQLAARDADLEGWTKVSQVLWPLIAKMPDDLLEKRPSDDGGHCRVTHDGEVVLKYC